MRRKLDDVLAHPWIYEIHDPSLPLGGHSDERLPGGGNGSVRRVNSGHYVTTKEIMETLDRLPQDVRAALGSASHPWAPHWAELVLRLGYSSKTVVERLQQADLEEARRRELQLLQGRG